MDLAGEGDSADGGAGAPHRPTLLRRWRRYRGITLEVLAETLGTTHATLSRIERGLLPYNQDLLEEAGAALGCAPVDLLVRPPDDPEGIWAIWERATPAQRRQIVEVAKALLRTSSNV